jgi:Kef-type K+ transport system membrane component KefB
MNQLSSREGTTILGAAVVDDIVVVILLAVMISFLGAGSGEVSIAWLVSKKVIFFAVIVAACIWLVPLVMKLASKLKVTEAVMSGAIVICLGFAYFAEWLGVAGIIGSFAAGLAISQTEFRKEVEHRVEPITYTLFVPVFFVSIGLNITFDGLSEQLLFMVLLSVVAILTKLIGCGFGAKITGFSMKSSLIIGAGMISRGEVALIIATTGLASGLIPQQYFTSIVLVVIVTTLVTPPLLKALFTSRKAEQQGINIEV